MSIKIDIDRPFACRQPARTLAAGLTLALTAALAACGGGGSGADGASASASAEAGASNPAAPAADASNAATGGRIVAISTKAALSSTTVTTSDLTKLTPLQVVQKIFHDQVNWYPGGNDPYSPQIREWARYASRAFFNSSRTFDQAYQAVQAAILTDARKYDGSIPVNGHPYPRADYHAPTLDWMEALTTTDAPPSTAPTLRLTPLQAVQQIFHDLVDWYPGGNNPNGSQVQEWAAIASSEYFTSARTYEEAYALLQARILTDARQYDSSIPEAGHPYPRAHYNAATLSWMTSSLDTDTSSGRPGGGGSSESESMSSSTGPTTPPSTGPSTDASNVSPSSPSTPPPAATGTINSVDTIVNDMKLRNDTVLRGYENQRSGWYVGPGYVMMGNDPRLSNTPSWWKAANPGRASGDYLRAALPWVVIFDGAGHNAPNTRVQIRNFRAYYKSKSSGRWISLGASAGVSGAVYGKSTLFGATTAETRRTNADGSSDIKPPSNTNYAWHGWWDRGRVTIQPADIAALFVTLQARLVLDDPNRTDDRDNARLLVQVGTDYYRDTTTSWPFVVPSAMTSRSKLASRSWQAFSATTFSNVGVQEPGGGITEAAFRAAPPPLE